MTELAVLGDFAVWDPEAQFLSQLTLHGRIFACMAIAMGVINILGPPSLLEWVAPYFQDLPYENYPQLIVREITNISHNTAVCFNCPLQIQSDLYPLTQALGYQIHCVISYFRDSENQHILTFLPLNYQGETVYSPGLVVEQPE